MVVYIWLLVCFLFWETVPTKFAKKNGELQTKIEKRERERLKTVLCTSQIVNLSEDFEI